MFVVPVPVAPFYFYFFFFSFFSSQLMVLCIVFVVGELQ